RPAIRERVLELVRPPGVVEEVRGSERHVDVARFADGLAAVARLEDGELAGALLEDARDAEQVFRALGGLELRPAPGVGVTRGAHRLRDTGFAALRDLGERLLARGVAGRVVLLRQRLDDLPADEQPVAV